MYSVICIYIFIGWDIVKVKVFLLIVGSSAAGLVAMLLENRIAIYIYSVSLIISAMLGIRSLVLLHKQEKSQVEVGQAYELIFRYMPCVSKIISPELDLLMINNETTQLTGIKKQGALGKKCYEVFGNSKTACPGCPVLKALETKKVCTANDQSRVFNDKKLCINQTAMPIFNEDGSIKYILEMSVDVTERKMLEQMNRRMFIETVSALAQLIDNRDHSTGRHSERVREIAVMIGKQLNLAESDLEDLAVAALLHDIGKIGIPEHILHKKGKLSPEEFSVIKRHTEIGHDALKNIAMLDKVADYVRFHHEAVDGSGYPCHLADVKIPLISKILCVADVYEALTADRVYRKAMTSEQALAIMRKGVGKQFDPKVLSALLQCIQGVETLYARSYRRQCIAN